jgi:predicted Rossmann fold nucleotide-binding protein DprA/Smf involved in DNA uptake
MTQQQQQRKIDTTAGIAVVMGDPTQLSWIKLGFVCSQKCAGDVILKAYDFARQVRISGRAVVSGFHSPIEKDCLPILLHGPGLVIVVQGRRLSTARFPAEWKKAIEAGSLLLISPFTDRQKRVTSQLAKERNNFVARLADEILIAYAHPGGKTEKLADELLKSGKRVYTFDSPANRRLVERGAISIEPDYFVRKQTGKAQSSADCKN